ncbi:dTDP-4-amino-4,6-dideoxygalactose transaminase [Bacillus thermophilus]|uniref:dTDP-4-amino-4,6-dideoxygalactose transaminase n=1 Tax=Siminovitchia thermophila TaxID=1245522 RepID=A0ABS2R5S6_9BACI|nr:DegT/DnrJ/EryC1/StrS family aminotransferase [Siminovitchia thermophila]MBM7714953.1 dTDP-4-amino-4,6-dideoxygalactose transaminase [Siminovitchia thermophila]
MKIPMLDLSEQYSKLREEMIQALDEVMTSSKFILGSNVKQIEEAIANYSNVKHGIGVANGSDALHISLQACGVSEGDEVITTPFTFFATAGAIARCGAKPVFVDIDPTTYNIDPEQIESAITTKTKAILPVHLYGQSADMDPIIGIAKKHGLYIVEDAAQAIGARYRGKMVGEMGNAACFSFFPTKNLGAYGDAGMIVTNDDVIAENCRVLRVHGSKPKYYHHVLGYNSRLDELQAAVLNVKFKHLNTWVDNRRNAASNYTSMIQKEFGELIDTPVEAGGNFHVYHQYTIRVPERDTFQSYLKENGVASMIYYPVPLHLQPVFQELGLKEGDFPESEKAAKEAISLPMFPEIKEEQQKYVIETMKKYFSKN